MSQPEEPGADNLSAWAEDGISIYLRQSWTSWELKVFLGAGNRIQWVAKKCLAFKQRQGIIVKLTEKALGTRQAIPRPAVC